MTNNSVMLQNLPKLLIKQFTVIWYKYFRINKNKKIKYNLIVAKYRCARSTKEGTFLHVKSPYMTALQYRRCTRQTRSISLRITMVGNLSRSEHLLEPVGNHIRKDWKTSEEHTGWYWNCFVFFLFYFGEGEGGGKLEHDIIFFVFFHFLCSILGAIRQMFGRHSK